MFVLLQVSVPGERFQLGISLINLKEQKLSERKSHDEALPSYEHVTGAWTVDEEKRSVYELTYTPNASGVHQMYCALEIPTRELSQRGGSRRASTPP